MKTLIALFLLSIASVTFASDCTFSIKDRYGFEYESVTRSSYSEQAACSDAQYACNVALSNGQYNGRYQDAFCERKLGSAYPPAQVMCTTDLLDYYGNIVRSFSGSGRTQSEACGQSNEFCKYELSRNDSYGRRCVTRGTGGNYPQPPRQTTENCTAQRFDPSGYFIQSYFSSFTGPVGTDVKGEACRRALNDCSYDIKGRQTCRI